MRTWNTRLIVLTIGVSLLLPTAAAFAAKKYQVTGKVLELTDKTIVVQKDEEKWEIERSAATKIEGDLKVGAKVTIYYHMVADSGEVKNDGKDGKK